MSNQLMQELINRPRNEYCARCGTISSEGLCGICERIAEEQDQLTREMTFEPDTYCYVECEESTDDCEKTCERAQ